MEQSGETATTAVERKRVEAVVETLANSRSQGESLAAVAHDARNMVTALGLYCDLLEEPEVLAPAFAHYGGELRLVAAASRRLVEKLVALDAPAASEPSFWRGEAPATELWPAHLPAREKNPRWEQLPSAPVANLAAELLATRNLLAALAGPAIALTVDIAGGAQPVRISGEDLTRVLVNLVKNAVEAMPTGGRIQIALSERKPHRPPPPQPSLRELALHEAPARKQSGRKRDGNDAPWLLLTIEDNGPGIPGEALEKIFASGYSAPASAAAEAQIGAAAHRGLGLAISRSIVAAAGGRIYAENRAQGGARIVMELPVEKS